MASFELGGSDVQETLGDTENQVSPLVEYKEFSLDFDTELDDMLYYSKIPNTQINSLRGFLIGNELDENSISKHAEIDGYIIIEDINGGEYIIGFNNESNEFYLEKRNIPELLESQNREQQNQVEEISKKERLLSSVMYAIEHIFRVNDREWMQRLNEDDTFSIDESEYPWSEIPEFAGKQHLQIQELQKVARNILSDLSGDLGDLDETVGGELKAKLAQHEERYLDYIVGIGDMYEGGANAFHSNENGELNVTQEEITTLVESIVANKTIEQCFEYMIEKHAEIEANNYQSTEVMRTYTAWNAAINKAVLHKMKGDNVEDKLFLQYAKIVSGRDVPEYSALIRSIDIGRGQTQEVRSSHSLDSDLFDVNSASEALLYVFEREGGIMSQIGEQITIEDPVLERMPETEKNPKHIFEGCAQLLEEKVEGFGDSGGEGLLGVTGFGNLFSLTGTESYEDLSISEKMQISILIRLTKKLESVQNPSNYNSRYRSQHNLHREWGNENGQISMDRLSSMFIEVAEDGQNAVIASINDNFDGGFLGKGHKDSSDFGLESYRGEIFDLYNDIWGNGGLFDMSDSTIEWIKFGAQFGAILVGSIALGMAALPVLTTAGILSVAAAGTNAAMITSTALASVAVSRVVMPEGYDSNGDMLLDVGTDCLVAVLFGRLGGALTNKTHGAFTQAGGTATRGWVGTSAGRAHLGSNIIDLSLFGIGSEVLRNIVIRNEFIEIPFTDSTLRIPFHMDESNRFSYSDFHQYVAPQIREYFLKRQEVL